MHERTRACRTCGCKPWPVFRALTEGITCALPVMVLLYTSALPVIERLANRVGKARAAKLPQNCQLFICYPFRRSCCPSLRASVTLSPHVESPVHSRAVEHSHLMFVKSSFHARELNRELNACTISAVCGVNTAVFYANQEAGKVTPQRQVHHQCKGDLPSLSSAFAIEHIVRCEQRLVVTWQLVRTDMAWT